MKNVDLEDEFPLLADIHYLNHAAMAPWPRRTRDAVCAFAAENAVQGSKNYLKWIELQNNLRTQMQALINAPSTEDIALVKNTSEGLSLVAFGLEWASGDNVVSSNEEFPANRIVWEALASRGVEYRQADLSMAESPEDALFALIDDKTRLISISSVQFGTGLQMDLRRIGRFCRERDILFCVDAIQSIGACQLDVQAIEADFVMADGHKWMLGPEGIGLFYCRAELRDSLQLHQYGWHMVEDHLDYNNRDWQPARSARRFECGSPNMLGIHALSASLSLLHDVGMDEVESRLLKKTEYLFEAIRAEPKLELLTDTRQGRYAGIVRFRHRQLETESVYKQLMAQGVMCAQRAGGVRYSPHFYTPENIMQKAVEMAVMTSTRN